MTKTFKYLKLISFIIFIVCLLFIILRIELTYFRIPKGIVTICLIEMLLILWLKKNIKLENKTKNKTKNYGRSSFVLLLACIFWFMFGFFYLAIQ